jgi:Holliday junction DNA helicase RuvA
MIALVRGELARKEPAGVAIIDSGTVGYRVFVSLSTLVDLPEPGEEVSLHTVTIVRDDALHLYGFINLDDLELFNLLVQVKGVGPKLALTILGGLKPADLRNAIAGEDSGWISTVPGVGKKTSERIILELKDKVAPADGTYESSVTSVDEKVVSDAVSALVNLGYKNRESRNAIEQVMREFDKIPDFDELIREVLGVLSGRKN